MEMSADDPVAFIRRNADIVRALAEEGKLTRTQVELCRLLGVLDG
jgi:hypothetical protein